MIEDFFVPEDIDEAERLAREIGQAQRVKTLLKLRERPLRRSQVTSLAKGTIYWRLGDRFVEDGLATVDADVVTITDLGRWVLRRRLEGS